MLSNTAACSPDVSTRAGSGKKEVGGGAVRGADARVAASESKSRPVSAFSRRRAWEDVAGRPSRSRPFKEFWGGVGVGQSGVGAVSLAGGGERGEVQELYGN